MMEPYRRRNLSEAERNRVFEDLEAALSREPRVAFAFVHGSFVSKPEAARDLDVAVHLRRCDAPTLEAELALESRLAPAVGAIPIDVRILNGAPAGFRFQVVKTGMAIAIRDPGLLSDFIEETLADYIDFLPHRSTYLREALKRGA
ncbi:MAG: nucleotidyltransferase domain-containing protein [Deltaproteobacteria bacterium]|nr:nucleotidyltransferase domain-containing protein [Deltaproteobacteria bacterium]